MAWCTTRFIAREHSLVMRSMLVAVPKLVRKPETTANLEQAFAVLPSIHESMFAPSRIVPKAASRVPAVSYRFSSLAVRLANLDWLPVNLLVNTSVSLSSITQIHELMGRSVPVMFETLVTIGSREISFLGASPDQPLSARYLLYLRS